MSSLAASSARDPKDLTERVRADLDAIFAEVGPLPVGGRSGDGAIHALRPGGPPRHRAAAIGAVAAAALAGVAIGAVVTHATGPAAPPPPTMTVQVAALAPRPAPAPQAARPTTLPVAAPAKVADALPAAHEVRRVPARTVLAACDGTRCDAAAVIAADRRLRRAYERAIRARAPRRLLVDYRDRWEDLRRADAERPAALVRGYDALANELGRAAGQDRPQRAEAMDPPRLRWPLW